MTPEDFEQLRRVGHHLRVLERIGLLSPVPKRRRRPPWKRTIATEHAVFPDATTLSRRRWDLDEPTGDRFDLLVASNVFMYARDPERWFTNVLDACASLLLIDLVRRQRSADSEFGRDGDCQRFAIGRARPRVPSFYDLAALGDRVLGWKRYPGGANEFDPAPVHLIALVRGNVMTAPGSASAAAVRAAQRELGTQP